MRTQIITVQLLFQRTRNPKRRAINTHIT